MNSADLTCHQGMRVLIWYECMRVVAADWFQIVIARFQTIFSYSQSQAARILSFSSQPWFQTSHLLIRLLTCSQSQAARILAIITSTYMWGILPVSRYIEPSWMRIISKHTINISPCIVTPNTFHYVFNDEFKIRKISKPHLIAKTIPHVLSIHVQLLPPDFLNPSR